MGLAHLAQIWDRAKASPEVADLEYHIISTSKMPRKMEDCCTLNQRTIVAVESRWPQNRQARRERASKSRCSGLPANIAMETVEATAFGGATDSGMMMMMLHHGVTIPMVVSR